MLNRQLDIIPNNYSESRTRKLTWVDRFHKELSRRKVITDKHSKNTKSMRNQSTQVTQGKNLLPW